LHPGAGALRAAAVLALFFAPGSNTFRPEAPLALAIRSAF